MQATDNFHHQIGHALFGEAQDVFDGPAPLDPSNPVFNYHARMGENPVVLAAAGRERDRGSVSS